ncbi:hypothetical protein EC973_001040 [Apophysomyces ossiformis]|uniref:Uncharacterized protein n=1 Tax=Apophysomyces ossiformis TaxID=679940 RepID=A0A8H7BUX4_9FUNG|nr:hypothetical protein EC973_001040 [Apophysomyces ossiformis]
MQPFKNARNQAKNIISYFLSFIGLDHFVYNTITTVQHNDDYTSACSFLTSSTLIVNYDIKNNVVWDHPWTLQSWINDLSKMALCQIVTTAALQYPTVANLVLQTYHASWDSPSEVIRELRSLQEQSHIIAHSFDHLRPSEQFSRAAEIAEEMQRVVPTSVKVLKPISSLAVLFGFMIIAQQGLCTPPEIRRHLFYQAKFGRTIVLEISSALKDYRHTNLSPTEQSSIQAMLGRDNWIDELADLCTRLSQYDRAWEFRREYEDVVCIAKRYI